MRLWTLVLASAFVWVVAPVSVLADAEAPAAEAPAAEAPAPETPAPDASAAAAPQAPEEVAAAEAPAPSDPSQEATATAGDAAAQPAPDVSWDDFEDPGFDPATATEPAPTPAVAKAKMSRRAAAIPLGPMGVDAKGVEGRIHTVSKGETLWDISEAYLGTPWVWPSVWNENQEIENPHLIEPGDRIWITSNEMRRVSDEEAEQMLSAADSDEAPDVEILQDVTVAEDESLPVEPPASAEQTELSVPVPLATATGRSGGTILIPTEQDANFTRPDVLENAAMIVDSPSLRAFLTQGDEVYLNLGEGQVSVGDEFTIFREVEKIRDVETGAVLGYHFDELGWLKVTQVEGESSRATVRGANSELQRGDHIVPRAVLPREVTVREALDDVEGSIVFTPGIRWMVGSTDSVYLNVGSIHGVEVGTLMEVYDRGKVREATQMPDSVVARMIVIRVEPESSVAYVTETNRELEIGDTVRSTPADHFAAR